MTQKPAKPAARSKRATAATAAEPAKPASDRSARQPVRLPNPPGAQPRRRPRRARSRRLGQPSESAPRTDRRSPSYDEISERAYFISLEEGGGDEVTNWLRAERELTMA